MLSHDLLFELGSEELPSGAVWPLVEQLAEQLGTRLKQAGLTHGEIHRYATPRRLAVRIEAVQTKQNNQFLTRRGPAVAGSLNEQGQPTPALLGFARSCGASVEQLVTVKTDKGEWWSFESEQVGEETCNLLPAMIQAAVASLAIPKPMRWGSGEVEFARPVHWAVLLWGNEVVAGEVLGVPTGRLSYGHRFHAPHAITIQTPAEYESQLLDSQVVADFQKRRERIVAQVKQLVEPLRFRAEMPEALLDEVTSIVEWPDALLVDFKPDFLKVPSEALIASMQSHQKCFALRNEQGELVPHFITVANIQSAHPQRVIAGNEKVMCARLSDASFFFHQDKKKALIEYARATEHVVLQAGLGTLQDKVRRLQVAMEYLAQTLQLDRVQALRAAELSKCDLMTGMVGEFPELQGVMGLYYAQLSGEDEAVALALNEQYLPRYAADGLPQSDLGLALSLADRLDALVGHFALGQKPNGMKDPFKLRRHALAVVRLLSEAPTAPGLSALIEHTLTTYGESLRVDDVCMAQLKPFILDRLQAFYQGQGVAPELIQAVRACQDEQLADLRQRVQALLQFIHFPDAASLAAACKRVNNLLQHAASDLSHAVDTALFSEPAEHALFERMNAVEQRIKPYYQQGNYTEVLTSLASLREPVDCFFEQVMVMVENTATKENRLNLLRQLQQLLQGVADISLLP